MSNRVLAGRISGIPVYVDTSLIVLIALFGLPYFTAGSLSQFSQGLWIVAGGVGSILVHELAHAWAGRIVRVEATSIELNGCGGLCCFDKPRLDAQDDIFVTLAGPASNLALWALFHFLHAGVSALLFGWFYDDAVEDPARLPFSGDILAIMNVLSVIAWLNISMFVFNLLPSFPLDGGKALAAFLSQRGSNSLAMKTVATFGYGVCGLCGYFALKGNVYMLVIAYSLFVANSQVLAIHGRTPWQRWD